MKVLVIGGCGFIGSHIVDRLLDENFDVRVFTRSPEKFRTPLRDVEYIFGDISDVQKISEALINVDVVVHSFSATVPITAASDPYYDVSQNLLPTISLLDEMIKASVRRIVFISSGGTVYGVPTIIPTPEAHPLRPISPYGIIKASIENYIDFYSRTYGMSYAVIRPSNPYGPRQNPNGIQGVISNFMINIVRDQAVTIWGDGSIVRDFIYIEDLARICLSIIQNKKNGVFNAGSGKGTSINEIIKYLSIVTKKKVNVVYRSALANDLPYSILDMSRTCEELNFTFSVSLSEGMNRLWLWNNYQYTNHKQS